MTGWLHDPLVQVLVVPLLAAFILGGLLRLLGGAVLASAAVGLAFLVAYVVIAGAPMHPPRSSEHKMVYIVAGAVAAGLVVDWLRGARLLSWLLAAGLPVLAVLWMAWPRMVVRPDIAFIVPAAVATVAGMIVLLRLDRLRGGATAPAVMLIVASLAAAAISFQGASLKYAMLFVALAAAGGGHLLWNWPRLRHPPGAALVLGGGGAFVTMGLIVALYVLGDPVSRLALLLLTAVFFMDRAVPAGTRGGALAPLVMLVPCAGVAAVAVFIAWLA